MSSEVTLAMADGLNKTYYNNLVFAVTGVAGPGGSTAKPVGTVFIAVSNLQSKIDVVKKHFDVDCATTRMKTTDFVLKMILNQLDLS